jgi:hypothetical protein
MTLEEKTESIKLMGRPLTAAFHKAAVILYHRVELPSINRADLEDLNIDVHFLEMPTRIYKPLHDNGIKTISQLVFLGEDISRCNQVGKVSQQIIKIQLNNYFEDDYGGEREIKQRAAENIRKYRKAVDSESFSLGKLLAIELDVTTVEKFLAVDPKKCRVCLENKFNKDPMKAQKIEKWFGGNW